MTILAQQLPISVQRQLLEHHFGGPVFRMWITKAELKTIPSDWSVSFTRDGRATVWRPELPDIVDPSLRCAIDSRRLNDDDY